MPVPLSKFTAAEMGDLLGISQNTLADLTRRGIVVKTKRNEYAMRESVRAYAAHMRELVQQRGTPTKTIALERERLTREQADREAMRNARLRGELVNSDEIERTWSATLTHLRAAILAIPPRLSHLSAADIAAVDRELRAALTEIGNDQ